MDASLEQKLAVIKDLKLKISSLEQENETLKVCHSNTKMFFFVFVLVFWFCFFFFSKPIVSSFHLIFRINLILIM